MQDTVTTEDVADFITNAAWAIGITYHMVLGSMPSQLIFDGDRLFQDSLPAWFKKVDKCRQMLVHIRLMFIIL